MAKQDEACAEDFVEVDGKCVIYGSRCFDISISFEKEVNHKIT